MPVLTNSIGSATFFDLVGTIYLRQQQVQLIDRPGVDGTGARLTGVRGQPFPMVSITYHTSFATYKTYFDGCIALKTSLQTLTRNSSSYGSFLVLDVVEAAPPQAVFNVAGAPGAQCRGQIAWTLLEP